MTRRLFARGFARARRALVPTLSAGLALWAAGCRRPTATAAPGPTAGRVLFFDGFDGDAVDRGRWTMRVTGVDMPVVNDEQQAYVDEARGADGTLAIVRGVAGAEGGVLRIRPRLDSGHVAPNGHRFDFVSGRMDTRDRFTFTYGTAAARMKLPAGAGLWPAFWILGSGAWPASGEIDVMENVGDPTWVSAAMHGPGYSGDTPIVKRAPFPPGQDVTGWHVYSADWVPDTITFRVDGRVIYTVPRTAVERYGRWAYDTPKFLIVNLALGGGYPRGVNGVTAPYPGLPASSVQAIREGRADVLVDWVRVTR